jgi:hypothetical protein
MNVQPSLESLQDEKEPKPKDKLPRDCASCGFHLPTKECRRHSPHPSHDEDFIVAFWNFTKDNSRCGAGTSIKEPVSCDDCLHWLQPNDAPLWPDYKQGLPDEWWAQSGLCTANPPGATSNEALWTYWRVTSTYQWKGSSGGCGDGVSLKAMREAEEKRKKRKPESIKSL